MSGGAGEIIERLIRLRDNLRSHSYCRDDCDLLAEAVNKLQELESWERVAHAAAKGEDAAWRYVEQLEKEIERTA